MMIGREDKKSNDLFYVCSLIEVIARKTTNRRIDVVTQLGKDNIQKLYDLADIYHSDNIERVSDDFIRVANITNGNFDNVGECQYNIPSHWDIGKVYKRLILGIAKEKNVGVIDALFQAYNSFVSEKIDNYNSNFYYENSTNILITFLNKELE